MNFNYQKSNQQHKKRIRYKFNTKQEQSKQQRKTFSFFYQVAIFANDIKGRKSYHMRKYIFETEGKQIVKMEEFHLSSSDCKKFYEIYSNHQYKLYNVRDLDLVDIPSKGDLETSLSPNLRTNKSQDKEELNSMYGGITGFDYQNLHNKQNRGGNTIWSSGMSINGVNGMGQSSNLDDGMINNFSSF
jgi:hypothetical protein